MKAYVLRGIGQFKMEEAETPQPERDEVLVSVRAAGICGSDIPRIYRTGTYAYPLIPGHEFAGEVKALGEGVDGAWLGKRVGIFPLIPCMECPSCRKKQYEMCSHYSYLGSRRDGGFAEYVRVPVWNLMELPDRVTFEQAAMMEPMSVAVHAIRRAGLGAEKKECTIGVCGLGTIGLFVVMFLKEMGYQNLLCIGNKDSQKKCLRQIGVEEARYCNSSLEDAGEWIQERTDHSGIEVFFECVGKNETVELAINAAAPKGTVMLVGNPASDMHIGRNTYWKILRRQLSVLGTWNSSYTREPEDDWHYVLRCLAEDKIHPEQMITHEFSLEKLQSGFELMRDHVQPYIKVMMVMQNNRLN